MLMCTLSDLYSFGTTLNVKSSVPNIPTLCYETKFLAPEAYVTPGLVEKWHFPSEFKVTSDRMRTQ